MDCRLDQGGPPSYNLDMRLDFGFCGGRSAGMLAIFAENRLGLAPDLARTWQSRLNDTRKLL
jgi:hypothetical protein